MMLLSKNRFDWQTRSDVRFAREFGARSKLAAARSRLGCTIVIRPDSLIVEA
jgi:hypothetical protein